MLKRTKLTLNKIELDLLIGTLLGDGYLGKRQKNNDTFKWRYEAEHSIKQEAYVWKKYAILQRYCLLTPVNRTRVHGVTNKNVSTVRFVTKYNENFKILGEAFYLKIEEGNTIKFKKIIPKNIEEFLTARVLAYWYMDDGTLNKKSMIFCTDAFKKEEVVLLRDIIYKKYNIMSDIKERLSSKNKTVCYRLVFNTKNSFLLAKIVKPYMESYFNYKLPKE